MIEVGLMWLCGKRGLAEAVTSGCRRYAERFGTWPNVCYASPGLLGTAEKVEVEVDEHTVPVFPDERLAPAHLWVGVENEVATS